MEQLSGINISLPNLSELPEGMEITIRRGITGGTQTATIPVTIPVATPVNQQAQFIPPAIAPPPVHSPPWKFPKLDFTTLPTNAALVGGKAKEWGKQYGLQMVIAVAVAGGITYPEAIVQGFNTIAPLFGVKTSKSLPPGGAIYPTTAPPAEQSTQAPPAKGDLPPVPEVKNLQIKQSANVETGDLPLVIVPKPEGEDEPGNISKLKDFVFNRQKQQQVEAPKFFFPLANASSQENSILTSRVGGIRPLGCNPKTQKCREHQGVDWVTKTGTMVAIASIDGKVTELQFHTGVGGIIAITGNLAGQEIKFRYVHLDHEMLRRFKLEQKVKAGEVLSTITKRWPGSSGAHLHFEAWPMVNGNRVLDRTPESLVKGAEMFEIKR